MAEYRIVKDTYAGFEVQARRWWFPVWLQCGWTNTHGSIARAEEFARQHATGDCGVVKNLGEIPSSREGE